MNYQQFKAIEKKNIERLLKVNPHLTNASGIYILTREENGFKYAYVGQAKQILTRLASHLIGYQHIDLSLKKHKLYGKNNLTGWQIDFKEYPICLLDEKETEFIAEYAKNGYQLRNKTSGGQGQGKQGIADNKPSKGYYDGIAQGKKIVIGEISKLFEKYLDVVIKDNPNKIKERKLNEFLNMIKGEQK